MTSLFSGEVLIAVGCLLVLYGAIRRIRGPLPPRRTASAAQVTAAIEASPFGCYHGTMQDNQADCLHCRADFQRMLDAALALTPSTEA